MEESDGNKKPTTSPTATGHSKEMPMNGSDVLAQKIFGIPISHKQVLDTSPLNP